MRLVVIALYMQWLFIMVPMLGTFWVSGASDVIMLGLLTLAGAMVVKEFL